MSLEEELRAIGHARYHGAHPFHRMLHSGELDRGQVQAWALNRFYYQAAIPRKDAALMARTTDPGLRRHWRRRLEDHDGGPGRGGTDRWLDLAVATGLDRHAVAAHEGVLPATRFAVEAYVAFVRERSLLEAVASSLTELFAPSLMAERVEGMLASYPFLDPAALGYFTARLDQAPRDSAFALEWILLRARTPAEQDAVRGALIFKCDVLWAQLDALYHAYVSPAHPPLGAFRPEPST